ncbi:cytochrome c-type biogenesis protein [Alicyclobacillus ferrooxydans]|uniref:Cytochrome c-type biogenesis protein n=1 Tax=Alicyclobacillus ferrooxydans TaxID=471514 RepID=A0A0P9CG83_9BACL|nr:cytochrome c-type biogenesis protein CcmH [Alicyclobacillus ferrooxydans]KPV42039.1 hypothetical protein AN477_19925 [Alicyclobacillus ferrooxydans]
MSKPSKASAKGPVWIAVIVVIILLLIGFGIRAVGEAEYNHLAPAEKVDVICEDLRAPGDPSTVANSSLGLAFEIRQQVAVDVERGMSKNQILDAMVTKYGDSVLAVPRFRGFGLLTWFAPLVVAVLVMWGIFRFIRRSAGARSERDHTESQQEFSEAPRVRSRLKDYL